MQTKKKKIEFNYNDIIITVLGYAMVYNRNNNNR